MMRSTSLLWACLCLAACGGDAPAAEPAQSAAPTQSAEDRAIKRRLRQAEEARRTEVRHRGASDGMVDETRRARATSREERDKAIRDAMHAPVDTFQPQRVP